VIQLNGRNKRILKPEEEEKKNNKENCREGGGGLVWFGLVF